MPTSEFTYSEEKFRELLLYMALKSEPDLWFGSVKLNKQLFYADFLSYARTGKPITGAKYRKLERGPAPKNLVRVKRELIEEQAAFEKKVTMPDGLEQHRVLALRRPKLDVFSAADIEIAHSVLDGLREFNATEVSNLSHRLMGWKLFPMGAEIPYYTACLPDSPLPLSPQEIEIGRSIVNRLRAAA